MPMNVLDAAFNMVNDYPGGAASLAPRMQNKSASTLAHEVRGQGTAKLGLVDALKIMDLADDNTILEAMAAHRCCAVVHLPDGFDPDTATGQQVSVLLAEMSALVQTILAAHADGVITANELADAERKWGRMAAAGQQIMRNMARAYQAGQPAPEAGGLA